MFSVHTTLEELENATVTGGKTAWKHSWGFGLTTHMIINAFFVTRPRVQISPVWRVFSKWRVLFPSGLAWKVGLTAAEIKLRCQIFPAWLKINLFWYMDIYSFFIPLRIPILGVFLWFNMFPTSFPWKRRKGPGNEIARSRTGVYWETTPGRKIDFARRVGQRGTWTSNLRVWSNLMSWINKLNLKDKNTYLISSYKSIK